MEILTADNRKRVINDKSFRMHFPIVEMYIDVFDHGEMGMAHGGMRQKAFTMYEETVNVPLIIHNPVLFPEAQTTNAYAALVDLMPTLASLAQVPNREDYVFKGTDLTPLFTDPDTAVQNEILFTFDEVYSARKDGPIIDPLTGIELPTRPKQIRAIFTSDEDGEWKYARYFDPQALYPPEFEMYHLRNGLGLPVDPFELDNLANELSDKYNDPTIVAKREQLAAQLKALEEERLQPLPGTRMNLPIVASGD